MVIRNDEPDVQRLHNAGKAILELAAQPAIGPQRRNHLVDDMLFSERLKLRLEVTSLHRAALDLSLLKQKQ